MTKRNKLIARLKGGLGNQLFIYATAKALAKELKSNLLLDTRSGFWGDKYKRDFRLDKLGIQEQKINLYNNLRMKLIEKDLFPHKRLKLVREHNIARVEEMNQVLVVDDYFQEEKHFQACKNEIIGQLSWPSIKDISTFLPISDILSRGETAVAIHGRLLRLFASDGTKVSTNDPKTLPYKYFDLAIENIIQCVPEPHFFVFSDDPKGFISKIDLRKKPHTLIQHNYQDLPEVDLYLMHLCKHFIISNSSYSWWAAWLAETQNTMIIAPNSSYWDNPNTPPERWDLI